MRRFRDNDKDRKRSEHEDRVAKWQSLTPEQQLAYIDTYQPNGAKRQRARLQKVSQ